MNVIKPRGLGILTKVYQDQPAIYLSIGVLGYFDFAAPDAFLPDTAMWPFVQGELPENSPLDLGMPKVCGEILVFGKATAKDNVAVSAMPVELAIGNLRKRAIVFGNRYWKLGVAGLHATEPTPFLEMPIDYAHGFGGPGDMRNPTGKGFDAERRTRAGEAVGLANVEAPDRPVVSTADQPAPYGFGPLDIAWSERMGKAGTYDEAWFKTRSPSAPLNQDPTLYNAAPQDQWRRDGWFALDEPFALAGFHAGHAVDRGRLPGMRARAFVRQKQPDGGTALLEVGLHLETIFLFASARKGVVLYRGRVPVQDVDGRDVTDVMIAYERMTDAPRPAAHYVEVFGLRTDPETKGLHAMNDLQLAPALPPDIEAEREAEREEFAAAQLEKRQRRLDRAYDAALAAGGLKLKPDAIRPKVSPSVFPTITPQDIARGEVDIAGFVAAGRRELGIAEAHAAESRATALAVQNEARAKQAARAALAPVSAAPPQVSLKPLHDLHARLSAVKGPDMSSALAKLEGSLAPRKTGIAQEAAALRRAVHDEAAELEGPVQGAETKAKANLALTLDGVRRRLLDAPQQDSAQMKGALRSVENALRPAPPLAPGGTTLAAVAPNPSAQAATATRAALARAVEAAPPTARGALLTTAESTEAAFARAAASPAAPAVTLPAVTFSSSQFEKLPMAAASPQKPPLTDEEKAALKAKLDAVRDEAERKSRLHNPTAMAPAKPLDPETAEQLRSAVADAAARGSSLSGCDLAGADLSGLSFRGLDLTGALFEKANLAGADFSGAQLARAVFTEASLAGARFDQADLRDANFCGVSAPGASFVGVDLTEARLFYANFDEADLTGAKFERSIILEAHFKNTVLRQTQWEKCSLMMSELAGADFSEARMTLCNFMKCDLTGARFRGATLFRVPVTSCPADGADFSEAHLTRMIASGGSSFVGGIFRRAFASRSNWFKVDLSQADFTRAELDHAFIGEAKAVEACFYRASLQQAFLAGTDFTDADFSEANLFKANLRHAVLDRAELRHASLYCAVTEGASWQLADLTKANLRLTVFARG